MKEILLLLVMFWNLENFFDPFENGPYTPTGEKFWTWKKFAKKRDDIARTICLAAEENGIFPAIIGLCEVENRLVLNQLTQNTNLAKLNYGVIHKDSPDRRGIDAALLYRKELFTPLRVRFIPTIVDTLPVMDTLPSRETVYVKGVFMGLDTLHCFVVHWPSKLGGRESLQNRMAASDCLKKITDSILCADSRANIIVMGDFNDSPDSEPVANLDNLVNMSVMERRCIEEKRGRMHQHSARSTMHQHSARSTMQQQNARSAMQQQNARNAMRRQVRLAQCPAPRLAQWPAPRLAPHKWCTYKYKGEWSRIDHFLVSPWMYTGDAGSMDAGKEERQVGRQEKLEEIQAEMLQPEEIQAEMLQPQLRCLFCDSRSSGVFSHRFLLEVDEVYLGYKIRRTLVGPRYNGGVSDHLPVILRVWGYEY